MKLESSCRQSNFIQYITRLNQKWIHESCFWIFIKSHFHEIFCPLVYLHFFSAKLDTIQAIQTVSILQGDLSNSKSIWHLSLKFDALWCRVCSAKIRAIFPANYFSKPGVQINFSVMTNPRKLSLLCCRRSSRLTWRPEARRYQTGLKSGGAALLVWSGLLLPRTSPKDDGERWRSTRPGASS